VVEPYSVAIKMNNGRGLVGYQGTSVLNNVHGPVITGISELSVNNKGHLILLLSMQYSA